LGLPRDTIASSLGISGGTVSNSIAKWKHEIGVPTAEAVMDFGVLAKGQNVTPLQCAEGFRILKVLRNCGISEDQFTGFVVKFYDQCKSSAEEPKRILSIYHQIFELDEPVLLARLPEFISKLAGTKRKLEREISILEQSKKNYKRRGLSFLTKRGLLNLILRGIGKPTVNSKNMIYPLKSRRN
jgi:hypothetical protein